MHNMKKPLLIILAYFLVSCNPFGENKVLDYENQLNKLVLKLKTYDCGTYSEDEIDEFEIDDFRELDIDLAIVNCKNKNPKYSGFFEENDSLIIFIKNSNNIMETEKRIIYDFKKKPRNFESQKISGASYKITKLNNRWYFSEIGFD